MKILVDKMPETTKDCLWAHRSLCGYICYASGNGEWSSNGCAVYYGGKCPYLKELPEEEKMSEWISVRNRLPQDGELVLTAKDGVVELQWHEKQRNGWVNRRGLWTMPTVDYWMPIPKLPEEKK